MEGVLVLNNAKKQALHAECPLNEFEVNQDLNHIHSKWKDDLGRVIEIEEAWYHCNEVIVDGSEHNEDNSSSNAYHQGCSEEESNKHPK